MARAQAEMAAASAAGDIRSLVSLICQTAERKIEDLIDVTTGPLVFAYYVYMETFHERPQNLDDFVDGLMFLDIKGIQMKRAQKAVK